MGRFAAANNAGRGIGSAGRINKPQKSMQERTSPIGKPASQGSSGISDGVTDPRILDAIMSKLAVVKKTLGKRITAAQEPTSKPIGTSQRSREVEVESKPTQPTFGKLDPQRRFRPFLDFRSLSSITKMAKFPGLPPPKTIQISEPSFINVVKPTKSAPKGISSTMWSIPSTRLPSEPIQKTKKPKPSTKRPSPPAISIAERILRPEPKPRSWDKPTVKKPPTPKINLSERLQRPKKKPKKSWNKKTPPSKIGLDPSKPKTSAGKKVKTGGQSGGQPSMLDIVRMASGRSGSGSGNMDALAALAGLQGSSVSGAASGPDLASLLGGLGGQASGGGRGGGGAANLAALLGGGQGGADMGAGSGGNLADLLGGLGGQGGGAGLAALLGGGAGEGGAGGGLASLLGGGMGGQSGGGGLGAFSAMMGLGGGGGEGPTGLGALAALGGLGGGGGGTGPMGPGKSSGPGRRGPPSNAGPLGNPTGMGSMGLMGGPGGLGRFFNPMGPGRPMIRGMTADLVRDLMGGQAGPVPMDVAMKAQQLAMMGKSPDYIADVMGDVMQDRARLARTGVLAAAPRSAVNTMTSFSTLQHLR